MKRHLNITVKLAFILVLFGAALLGSLEALAYTIGRDGLRAAATSELLTQAIEKQSALERWFTEARNDITAKSASPVVVEQAAILLSAAPGSPGAIAAHDRLLGEFQPAVGPETAFTDLLFIDARTGEVLASTDPREEGKFKESQSYFINGKRKPYVSEVYYSTSLGRPAVAAAAPVIAADGRLLGVVAGRLDMNILNALISQRTGLHQTDDSYLVNAAGLLVTQPRFISDPAVLQVTLKTEADTRCLDGNSGIALYDDYRGQAVIGVYRWLPAYRVCLITKFDQAEAFAPSQLFGRTLAGAAGLALMIAIVLAIVLARTFTRPITALQTGAARLGQGDLEYRVAVKSNDEIGLLAAAFNEMAASLEKQVAERKRAEEVLERRVNELIALNTMAEIVAETIDAQQISSRALTEALALVDVNAGALMLLDPASGDMVMAAHRGLTDTFVQAAGRMKPGEGLTWQAAASGKPAVMPDMSKYPGALKAYVQNELIQSAAVIPLLGRTGVVGTMNLATSQPRAFDAAGLELLTTIGKQIAIGLEKAQLYAALQDELAERKRAEERLRLQSAALESAANAVVISDRDGAVLWVNPAFSKLTGYTEAEVIGQNLRILKSGRQSSEFYQKLWEAVLAGQVWNGELINRRKDGSQYIEEMTITPVRDERDKIINFVAIKQDITERKRAEDVQRKNAARATMLAEISQSLAEVAGDPQAALELVARRVTELIGDATIIRLLSKDGLYLDPVAIYHPDPALLEHLRELYASVRQGVHEGFAPRIFQTGQALLIPSITKEQIRASIEPRLWPLLDLHSVHSITVIPLRSQGRIIGLLSVMRIQPGNPYTEEDRDFLQDLADRAALAITNTRLFSDLQAYSARLEQSNRDLEEFAYVASHDLQEPLRKVLAFSDRLANKYGDALDETGRDYLKRMQGASQRMQTLINDLLTFARVSTRILPFTKVDLNAITRAVLSDLEERIQKTGGRVEIGKLPAIEADPIQMHQLLQNLVGNAIKYHHKERAPMIEVTGKTEGGRCQIIVKDNGIGFDPQYLDRMFKPFQRLHGRDEYEGAGMGLAICRRIVERHHGEITAASVPDQGSTFIVTLPIYQLKGVSQYVS